MDESRKCFLCNESIADQSRNVATYDCGHCVHLHCALQRASQHHTHCVQCSSSGDVTPDLGQDRQIALAASTSLAVRRRMLQPPASMGFWKRLLRHLSPFVPAPHSFRDHVYNKTSLDRLQRIGFTHRDAVHEGIAWSALSSRYSPTDLLLFGFTWEDMVSMGVTSKNLQRFTWPQLRHSLNLDARKLLDTDITLSELADLQLTAHQLSELGFTWDTLMAMGADVHTLKKLDINFEDIKLLWNPPAGQLHKCGFYDRRRLQKAGWNVDNLTHQLPALEHRNGRALRLAF
jgi:hypothetical protein